KEESMRRGIVRPLGLEMLHSSLRHDWSPRPVAARRLEGKSHSSREDSASISPSRVGRCESPHGEANQDAGRILAERLGASDIGRMSCTSARSPSHPRCCTRNGETIMQESGTQLGEIETDEFIEEAQAGSNDDPARNPKNILD